MSFSNTYETNVLTWTFTTGAVTRPTAWYIGLFTSDPGEASGGAEVSGGGYAREPVSFAVAGDRASNAAAIEWPVAVSNWGEVTHIAVCDALTGGVQIAHASVDVSKEVSIGDVFRISAGSLELTLD